MSKWPMVRLGDVCTILTDGTHQTPEYVDNGYIFLSSKNVVGGKIDWGNVKYIPEDLHKQLFKRVSPQKGDVLLAKNGTTGIAAVVDRECVFDIYVSLALLRPNNNVLSQYLLYAINNPYTKNKFDTQLKGIGVPNLHLNSIKNTVIPLPPHDEQNRIAAVLDKAQSLIDLRKKQIADMDVLAQSVFLDMFGDPVRNEKGWEACLLGNDFEIQSGGTPQTNIQEYWEGGIIPWIGSNMCQNRFIYNNDGKYITEKGCKNSSAKWFKEGWVLIALVGATIGKCALLKFSTTTNQNVAGINVPGNKDYTSEFVFFLMQNMYYKFLQHGNGDFKMASLSFLKQMPFFRPPIELQKEFSRIVYEIELHNEQMKQGLTLLEQNYNALMQQYFS